VKNSFILMDLTKKGFGENGVCELLKSFTEAPLQLFMVCLENLISDGDGLGRVIPCLLLYVILADVL
jgi:hypothetical protein